jgi:hypothetical protein
MPSRLPGGAPESSARYDLAVVVSRPVSIFLRVLTGFFISLGLISGTNFLWLSSGTMRTREPVPNHFLRLVYIGEFLVAIMATLDLWSQVGGQGHLDLMPWYLKLALTGGLALVIVMGTVAAVSQPDAWNAKTIAFVILGLLIAGAMAAATYYYHLHENDEENDDETKPAVAELLRPGDSVRAAFDLRPPAGTGRYA